MLLRWRSRNHPGSNVNERSPMIRHIAVGCVLVVLSCSAFAAPVTPLPIRSMYVLGDSLSDQGNLLAATTALGAATQQPGLPDPTHYFEGRFSNGGNYVDALAAKLGIAVLPSLAGGTNFAFGGARTDYNVVEQPFGPFPPDAFPWSLSQETDAFLAQAGGRRVNPTALFVVFSGSNDLADVLALRLDPATTIAITVEGIRDAILAFKSAGARTILVPNAPNLGKVPLVTARGPAAVAFATALSVQYNAALEAMLETIDGVDIIRFDTFAFLTDVVDNPAKYGFTNSTQPCYSGFVVPDPTATECADPDAHVFWDGEHPTSKLYAVLADELYTSVLRCDAVAGDHGGSDGNAHGPAPGSRCLVNTH
jgi:phospholipase/lecithinase/hemolysin